MFLTTKLFIPQQRRTLVIRRRLYAQLDAGLADKLILISAPAGLRLAHDGLSNPQIAEQMGVAVGTVKRHINHIFSKLGVTSRTQALARARELGLLS